MILSEEKINYLLDAIGVDGATVPSLVIFDEGDDIVQILYKGTAEECLQFLAEKNYPEGVSFVTEENFRSFRPELIRPN